jgi:hypothetical protein
MEDNQVLGRIEELVAEERRLRELLATTRHGEGHDEGRQRLRVLEASLDQCWDLLRQRRAARDRGEDPDESRPRDISTVEHYEQ